VRGKEGLVDWCIGVLVYWLLVITSLQSPVPSLSISQSLNLSISQSLNLLIPMNYTLPLALVDFLPVLFTAIGLVNIARMVGHISRKHGQVALVGAI